MRATKCCDSTCEACIANERAVESVKKDVDELVRIARYDLGIYFGQEKDRNYIFFDMAVVRVAAARMVGHSIGYRVPAFEDIEREVQAEMATATTK